MSIKSMAKKHIIKSAVESYKQAKEDLDNGCYDVKEFEKELSKKVKL